MERTQAAAAVAKLFSMFNREPSQQILTTWCDALEPIPAPAVLSAISEALKVGGQHPPSVPEVLRIIRDQTEERRRTERATTKKLYPPPMQREPGEPRMRDALRAKLTAKEPAP